MAGPAPKGEPRPIDHMLTETEFESVVIPTPFTARTTYVNEPRPGLSVKLREVVVVTCAP